MLKPWFRNNSPLFITLNRRFLTKGSGYGYRLSVAKADVAEDLFQILKPFISTNIPVLELYPGQGLITEKLLKMNLPELILLEPREEYYNNLKLQYRKEIKQPFVILNQSFYPPDLTKKSCINEFTAKYHLASLAKKQNDWKAEDPAFKIITVHQRFETLLLSLLKVCPIMALSRYGRPEMLASIPSSEWDPIFTDENLKPQNMPNVMRYFDLFFNAEKLGELPRNGFQPGSINKKATVTVAHIIPKYDLFDTFEPEEFNHFLYFILSILRFRVRGKYIIPVLEKWLPGCGRDLVIAGFELTKKFNQLSTEELVKLFKVFHSHPNYDYSWFLINMQTPPNDPSKSS